MRLVRNSHILGFLILAILLATSWSGAIAGGSKVILSLKDSSTVTGELLVVRDSTLIIHSELWLTDRQLATHPQSLVFVHLSDVRRIHLAGHGNPIEGMRFGLLAGVATGAFLGYHAPSHGVGRDFHAMIGAIAGILPGMMAGIIVGSLIVTDEQDIDPADDSRMGLVTNAARYTEGEPDFIKNYVPR